MRRIWLAGGLLLLTGCPGTVGPFQHRTPERVDDPCFTIGEQQRRGRDRLPLPEESRSLVPYQSGVGLPGPTGR